MKVRLEALSLALLLTPGWLLACSQAESNQSAATAKAKNPKPAIDGDNDGADASDTEDDGDAGDDGTCDDGSDGGVNADSQKAFSLFCERAAEIDAVQAKLALYLNKFCADGKPTKVFTKTLVTEAYNGSGDPVLKKMGAWEEDSTAKTTTGFFGVGIKIPIPIADHFDKVGPKAGQEPEIRKVIEAGGATPEVATVLKQHTKDGNYHIRGWTVEQKAGKLIQAINLNVTTHTISRSDQYELEKGSVYLYTQYITEAKATIQRFDTFTAGIKVGSDNYLLTVSRVTIDNKGFHPVAMENIRDTANDVVTVMYDAAKNP